MKQIVLAAAFSFFMSWLGAQSLFIESLTIEDGLSQGMIFDILQDREGFLWIATKDGLNRYDGRDFKYYNHDPFDPHSISGNTVTRIIEDSHGRLWLGTENNGLGLFDKTSELFFNIRDGKDPSISLSHFGIKDLAETAGGLIWAGTNIGLNRIEWLRQPPEILTEEFNIKDYIRVRQFYFGNGETDAGFNFISSLFYSSKNELWVSSYNQILRLDMAGQVLEEVVLEGNPMPEIISRFSEDSQGNMWISRRDGLFRNRRGIWAKIQIPDWADGNIGSRAVDQGGDVFVNSNRGLLICPATGNADSLSLWLDFEESPQITRTTLMNDRAGNFFIGTGGYGIRKYNPEKKRFQHFVPGTSLKKIFQDQNGQIWVVYWDDGQFKTMFLDEEDNRLEFSPSLGSFYIDILQTKDGSFWGLYNYNAKRKSSVLLEIKPGSAEKLEYHFPNMASHAKMMEDHAGNIWISDTQGGLVKFFTESRSFQFYSFNHLVASTPQSVALIEDVNHHFWIGTEQGLVQGIPQGDSIYFVHFKNEPDNRQSLNNNFILSLCDDPRNPEGLLWIGTKGGGLNLLDKKTGKVEHLTTDNGLPNNVVYGILPDGQGNLWMSTNRGLSKFNPQNRAFENYTATDGLQDNEFNTQSYAKGTDGRFFFGGINGLTAFYPEDLQTNNYQPPVFITALKINNQSIHHKDSTGILTRPIEQTSSISLEHFQNFLSFEFAALDYTAPEKNQYQYFLEGVNPEWVFSGNDNTANYANVAPGEYVFYVKGSNSGGVWNEDPAVLRITILPPWWETNLAYSLYLLIILGVLFAFYRFQINRAKLQNQLTYEQKEAERLTELDRIKTNFFSNITHEFRTPLTLIIEPLRQVIAKPQDPKWLPKIKLAEGNSRKLLQLVNQLLDLSKLEGKKMTLDLRRGDILETIRPIFRSFLSLSEKKGIHLKFSADKDLGKFYFDKNKVEKVVYNLLSNAVKFTSEGKVQLAVGSGRWAGHELPTANCLLLTVKDTGKGIPSEELPKIFDRFYQVDATSTRAEEGTGIGLSLTKELVELMGGTIEVESEVGAGTKFEVRLPMKTDTDSGTSSRGFSEKEIKGKSELPLSQNKQPAIIELAPINHQSPIINHHSQLILLIEDNPEMRQFIKQSLPETYQVVEASNGEEGINKAVELIPDLVISDLMMPKKDGFEVTDFLKNDERTSHIPIILLTAKSAIESKITGLKRGADAYLTKPFHTEELEVRIENLIENRRVLQEKFSQKTKTGNEKPVNFFSNIDNGFLRKFSLLIEDKIDDETLSVETLSREMNLSRSQLHRKLKALTGQPPNDLVRNYRLDRAMELLENKEGNVMQVSLMVGFGNEKYFSTRFKERFGRPPSEV